MLPLEKEHPHRRFALYQKIPTYVRQAVIFAVLTWLILSLLIYGNHYRTSYVIDTDQIGGTNIYQHQDGRTTNIVNYLTGKGNLPERERLPLYRQYLASVLEEAKMSVPINIYTMEKHQLDAVAIGWYIRKFPGRPRDSETLQSLIDRLFENAVKPPLEGFPDNVHDRLWELLIAVGSPKIRWVQEQDEYASQVVAYSAGHKQSFYDPTDNTIYISYRTSVNVLLDEVGHAKQFRKDPVWSYTRLVYSMSDAFIRAGFSTREARELYQDNYKNPDSFEGQAHGTIKNILLRQFGLVVVDNTVPEK